MRFSSRAAWLAATRPALRTARRSALRAARRSALRAACRSAMRTARRSALRAAMRSVFVGAPGSAVRAIRPVSPPTRIDSASSNLTCVLIRPPGGCGECGYAGSDVSNHSQPSTARGLIRASLVRASAAVVY
eukprot:585461-Prymnesium_polylepis.1